MQIPAIVFFFFLPFTFLKEFHVAMTVTMARSILHLLLRRSSVGFDCLNKS